MGRLNQIIAVVAGKKKKATDTITEAYHKIQKAPLFSGISRVYSPKDEVNGDKLPSESNLLQVKVADLISEVTASMVEMFDVVATQDSANCLAKGDVFVNGELFLSQIPVTHLLFLEKQLKDVETFIGKLPTLDPSERWDHDKASDCYATPPSETIRTKKVQKSYIKYDATKEHPAQIGEFQEDILVGYWKTIKFSGAIPASEKNKLLERVRRLSEGVIKAREEANSMEVSEVKVGKMVFDFLFR